MFSFFKKWRRQRILREPFPPLWREILRERLVPYSMLTATERAKFEQLVQVFSAEKNFEGCQGLVLTDEIKVVIAGHACLLILNLPHDYYAKVVSILVYPSTVKVPPGRSSTFGRGPLIAQTDMPIVGQAFMHGTVILVWDAIKRDATHPRAGHNVVYHEFAHILDMFDGRADGTPTLPRREDYRRWAEVCTRIYFDLQKRVNRGKKTFLSGYGATNEAEFFAVATEYFFNRPAQMARKRPELYEVLRDFYRQDTAARQQAGMDQVRSE